MSDEKFNNKYRIPPARAQWWDYGNNAAYFITICSAQREHFFGDVTNGKMQLSPIGIIADVFWHEIKKHADFIKLGEFVVMPNHIHGILIIEKPDEKTEIEYKNATIVAPLLVETRHALSLQIPQQISQQIPQQISQQIPQQISQQIPQQISQQIPKSPGQNRFQNQGKNTISSIIGGYKSVVTNHAHRLGFDFKWQSRFHDHIIRNEIEYQRIANYIINNPVNWKDDKFYLPLSHEK